MNSWTEGGPLLWVTAFLAALGWAITHFVDRIVSSPAVEYQLNVSAAESATGQAQAKVLLTNLSRTTAHEDVIVRLRRANLHSNLRFIKDACEIIAIPPASLGTDEGRAACDEEVAEFRATILPPQGRAALLVKFTGSGNLSVQGGSSGKKASQYYLAPCGFQTWLARWEFPVLFGALGVWLVLLVIWLFFAPRFRADKSQARR